MLCSHIFLYPRTVYHDSTTVCYWMAYYGKFLCPFACLPFSKFEYSKTKRRQCSALGILYDLSHKRKPWQDAERKTTKSNKNWLIERWRELNLSAGSCYHSQWVLARRTGWYPGIYATRHNIICRPSISIYRVRWEEWHFIYYFYTTYDMKFVFSNTRLFGYIVMHSMNRNWIDVVVVVFLVHREQRNEEKEEYENEL